MSKLSPLLSISFLPTFPRPINSESILVDPRMGEPALEMDRENSDEVSQIGTDVPYRY